MPKRAENWPSLDRIGDTYIIFKGISYLWPFNRVWLVLLLWYCRSACPLLTWHILSQSVLDNMQREALWGLKSNVNSTLEVERSKKSKGRGQPEVEQVRRTLQFSTSVEVRPGVVRPWSPDLSNRSMDFANFWSEVTFRNSKNTDRALFSKKIFLNDPIKKNCFFWPFR